MSEVEAPVLGAVAQAHVVAEEVEEEAEDEVALGLAPDASTEHGLRKSEYIRSEQSFLLLELTRCRQRVRV